MRVIAEGPAAHLEALAAWDADESATILGTAKHIPAYLDRVAVYSGSPALITWTSGTKNEPKGVVIPWPVMGERCTAEYSSFGGAEVLAVTMSMFGQGTWRIMPARMGCAVVVPGSSIDDTAALIRDRNVTCLFALPRQLRVLLRSKGLGKGALKQVVSAGEPLDAGLRERLRSALGVPVVDCYGTTEAGVIALCDGTGLRTVDGVDARVTDGVVEMKTSRLAAGWVDAPFAIDTDGWCRTDDLGALSGNSLTLKGREKNV